MGRRIADRFREWEAECEARFRKLRSNEEALNRIFIDLYGLQDELTPEVEDKDVTVRRADLTREIKSLISYAVGCMFGRYSPDAEGLVYAGGDWDSFVYRSFQPDRDGILPVSDDGCFENGIVAQFEAFLRAVYGADTLEENLQFVAEALGGGGSPREVLGRYFQSGFFADHCRAYQKRPIYWLFDSGRKNGFKCLIYLHRYRPDTVARIRTEYLHRLQAHYRTAIAECAGRAANASGAEQIRLNRRLKELRERAEEAQRYDGKLRSLADRMIVIDPDDGVQHNYAIFRDVLAEIR